MRILFLDDSPIISCGIGSTMKRKGIEVRFTSAGKAFSEQNYGYLEKQILEFKPDAVFNEGVSAAQYCSLIYNVLKKYNIPYIYWAIDDPVETMGYSLPHAKIAALTLTPAIECIPKYKRMGIDAALMMFGCDSAFHKKGKYNPKFDHDIVFVGNNYWWYKARAYGNRTMLKPLIDRGYDVMVYGNEWWWCPKSEFILDKKNYGGFCKYEELPDAYASARIILGLHSVGHSTTMMSMRTFEVLGCGGFYLSQYVPSLEASFKKGVHLEWSKNSGETLRLVDYYLKNSDLRKKIAAEGQRECYGKHDYESKIDSLINELKKRNLWKN